MEFNRLFNIFTISAIIIMLFTTLVSAGFAVRERAENNMGHKTASNLTIIDYSF
jgi:hypothetical protein